MTFNFPVDKNKAEAIVSRNWVKECQPLPLPGPQSPSGLSHPYLRLDEPKEVGKRIKPDISSSEPHSHPLAIFPFPCPEIPNQAEPGQVTEEILPLVRP